MNLCNLRNGIYLAVLCFVATMSFNISSAQLTSDPNHSIGSNISQHIEQASISNDLLYASINSTNSNTDYNNFAANQIYNSDKYKKSGAGIKRDLTNLAGTLSKNVNFRHSNPLAKRNRFKRQINWGSDGSKSDLERVLALLTFDKICKEINFETKGFYRIYKDDTDTIKKIADKLENKMKEMLKISPEIPDFLSKPTYDGVRSVIGSLGDIAYVVDQGLLFLESRNTNVKQVEAYKNAKRLKNLARKFLLHFLSTLPSCRVNSRSENLSYYKSYGSTCNPMCFNYSHEIPPNLLVNLPQKPWNSHTIMTNNFEHKDSRCESFSIYSEMITAQKDDIQSTTSLSTGKWIFETDSLREDLLHRLINVKKDIINDFSNNHCCLALKTCCVVREMLSQLTYASRYIATKMSDQNIKNYRYSDSYVAIMRKIAEENTDIIVNILNLINECKDISKGGEYNCLEPFYQRSKSELSEIPEVIPLSEPKPSPQPSLVAESTINESIAIIQPTKIPSENTNVNPSRKPNDINLGTNSTTEIIAKGEVTNGGVSMPHRKNTRHEELLEDPDDASDEIINSDISNGFDKTITKNSSSTDLKTSQKPADKTSSASVLFDLITQNSFLVVFSLIQMFWGYMM